MRRSLLLAYVSVFVVALPGCSDSVNDLFKSGAQGGAGGGTSTKATSGTTATNATSTTHASTNATTSTNGPTTNATTTTTNGQTATTAVTTVATTVNVVSSSSGPNQTVSCGVAGNCDINTSVCCYNSQSHNEMCTTSGACHQSGTQMPTAISCQGPNDCQNGDSCCGVRYFNADNQPYEFAQCQGQCDLPDRVVCDITNPNCPVYTNSMGMPVQSTCKPSSLLPQGYYICGF